MLKNCRHIISNDMDTLFDPFDEVARSLNDFFEESDHLIQQNEDSLVKKDQALIPKEQNLVNPTWSQALNEISEIEIPLPLLQNVIASVDLCTDVDLRRIAISARNAEYNPTKVNAVIIRLRNPKCTGLIFRSGKMMLTGAKSIEDVLIGGRKIAKLCLKIGHPGVRFKGFKTENLIASAECGFPIRLEGLAHDHRVFCSYEPELFPGLVYRYNPEDQEKAVLLVFVSGKVLITGCQTLQHVNSVFSTMYPVLSQYQK